MPPEAILAVVIDADHKPTTTTASPPEFLRACPSGAYTALVVFANQKVFGWDMHCQRLIHTLHRIREDSHDTHIAGLVSNPSLAGQLAAELKAAILQLRKALAETCGMDTMIVLHAQAQSPRESSTPHLPVVVRAYAKAMRFDWFLTTPITAQLVVYSRGLADCKISTWAAIRLPLQANYAEDVHEGLLVDDQGRVLEGLTSNFFAVKQTEEGHIVETSAAEGEEPLILDGVMRRLVLLACTFVSIDVELVSPSIASAAEWSEAFTTNSVQGLRAVGLIRSDTKTVLVKLPHAPGPVFYKLRDALPGILEAHATTI